MSFKENLRNELDYQDLTVKELASRSGLNKRTLDNYLTGHNSMPPADIAVKLADVLGVTVEYLIKGKDSGKEVTLPPKIRDIVQKLLTFDKQDVKTISALTNALSEHYFNSEKENIS